MNTKLPRHARLLAGIGAGAVLVGLAATACDSTPTAAPAPKTTTSTPSSSSAAPTTSATPAPVVVGSTATAPSTTAAKPAPAPVLGVPWSPGQKGYGTVRPTLIDNGGDSLGVVEDVKWQSWGGPTAIATGNAYDAHNVSAADSVLREATVYAFDLGECNGKLTYRAIEWYFPYDGEKFRPNSYWNICTGTSINGK
jgi:hypothetical protein